LTECTAYFLKSRSIAGICFEKIGILTVCSAVAS